MRWTGRLRMDYAKCERIMRKRSVDFHLAFHTLKDVRKRRSVAAIYAFCRMADDLSDKQSDMTLFDSFEQDFFSMLKKNPVNSYVWRALSDVFDHHAMEEDVFFTFLKGQRIDHERIRIQTIDQLLSYCEDVAGTVGKMLVPVLAPKNAVELKSCGEDLGVSMQLVDILRDIGEDAKEDRVYLPAEKMTQFDVRVSDLKEKKVVTGFKSLFEEIAVLAEERFERILRHVPLFPIDSRRSIVLSVLFYKEILDAIREQNYDVFSKRIELSPSQKMKMTLKYHRLFAHGVKHA